MASVGSLFVAAASTAGILLFCLCAVSATSAGTEAPARPACDAIVQGGLIVLVCVRAQGASLTGDCCAQVLQAAADKRGLRCLCQVAATPDVVTSGYTVADVLGWYSACGGCRPVNVTDLASTCSDRVVGSGNI